MGEKQSAQPNEYVMKIHEDIRGLEEVLLTSVENGLFSIKDAEKPISHIKKSIDMANKALNVNPPDVTKAREAYNDAFELLYLSINESFWYRFTYSYGFPIIAYFLLVLASIFTAAIYYSSVLSTTIILGVPSWAYLWGSVGGTLQGLWWLWQELQMQSLRKHLLAWYFLLPLMGGILGALTYLLFFAGLISSTGSSEITEEFLVMLLSAIAGFSSKWAIEMLNKVTKIIQTAEPTTK